MRKTVSVIVSVFVLFLFISCGLKKPPEPIQKPEKVEDPLKAPRKGGYELAE
jgi:hypothetical protein